jgi:hypothetical protein
MVEPIFRLFVSSTFQDMRIERDALQRRAFPELRERCASRGAEFRVVDFRWGIPEAAARHHSVPTMCLQEVHAALRTAIEPRLLCLLGTRYGWRPLPPYLKPLHMAMLHQIVAERPDANTLGPLLARYYVLDENAVPHHYTLVPSDEASSWVATETVLRSLIDAITTPADAWLIEHGRSLTEREIRVGLAGGARALAVVRDLTQARPTLGPQTNFYVEADPAFEIRQLALIHEVRAVLPDTNQIVMNPTAEALTVDGTAQEIYIDDFIDRTKSFLLAQIDEALDAFAAQSAASRQRTLLTNSASCIAENFIVRREELSSLHKALKDETARIIVVTGIAGSGKTTLLARLWAEAYSDFDIAICRLSSDISAHNAQSYLRGLLADLLAQQSVATSTPQSESGAIELFRAHLNEAGSQSSILVLLDGVDETPGLVDSLWRWLPHALPGRVRVVLSVRTENVARISLDERPAIACIGLHGLSRNDGEQLLDTWLQQANRQLQPSQKYSVLGSFAAEATPLWLRLAFEQAAVWPSYLSPPTLPHTTSELITETLNRGVLNPDAHFQGLARRAIALIDAAREGISETELLTCIANDTTFWAEFDAVRRWDLPQRQVPDAMWGRLLADLALVLVRDQDNPNQLLRFKHAAIGQTIQTILATGSALYDPSLVLERHFDAEPLRINGAPNSRKLVEWPYHLARTGQVMKLVSVLTGQQSWLDAHVDVAGSHRGFFPTSTWPWMRCHQPRQRRR